MSTTKIEVTRKRQSMAPGAVVVQKTPVGMTRASLGGTGSYSVRRNVVGSSYGGPPPSLRPTGEAGKVTRDQVQNVMSTRGKEKKDIAALNARFANYIENVKFTNAQNAALVAELEKLRKMKGYTQDRVKLEYEDELKEARASIEELTKQLAPLQSKNLALEDKVDSQEEEIQELRKQLQGLQEDINKMNTAYGDLEGENAGLRNKCDSLYKEISMLKSDVQRVRDDNDRLRGDLEAAITKQLNAENELHATKEELQFIIETTNHEIEELRNLLANLKSNQPDLQKMWKSEFRDAVNDIQKEYNEQLDRISQEQQARYDEQLASIQANLRRDGTDSAITKTENKTLKTNLGDAKNRLGDLEAENARLLAQLRALQDKYDKECEECAQEKQELNERIMQLQDELEDVVEAMREIEKSKTDLELEICCYKKLLDNEENSMKRMLEQNVYMQSQGGADMASIIMGGRGGGAGGGGSGGSSGGSSSQQSSMGESTGMVRLTRSSRVSVSIAEAAQDGSYVRLENSSKKDDFDLSGWTLERKYPKGTSRFTFPRNSKVKKESSIRIFSAAFDDMASEDTDFKAEMSSCRTWGTGNGGFSLKNQTGDEKASCTITYNVK